MSGYQIEEYETDGLCGKNRRDKKCIHIFSRKTRKEAIIGANKRSWKDVAEMYYECMYWVTGRLSSTRKCRVPGLDECPFPFQVRLQCMDLKTGQTAYTASHSITILSGRVKTSGVWCVRFRLIVRQDSSWGFTPVVLNLCQIAAR
jgi:hypothetical protein